MDFGSPVAQNVNVDPAKGINTLSSLIGIKQQQQDLQTGQINQNTAQATSQQAQQKNQEMGALAKFTASAIKDPKYQLPDGSPDTQKFTQDAMSIAPTYGQEFIGHTLSNFGEGVKVRTSLQSLSKAQNDQLGGALQGVASNPNSTRSDLLNAIEQQRVNNKDPAYNRALDNLLLSTDMSNIPGSAGRSAAALRGISQNTPSTIDTGGTVQPGATNQFSGAFTPAGTPVQKTLAPNQTPGYVAQTAAAQANASTRAGGVANSDIDRANQISASSQPASASIRLSQEVDSLADQINSGKIAEGISKAAGAVGISPVVYARQLLEKNLGQLKSQATASAPSDTARNTITSGFPEATSAPQTIHGAMDYIRGAARQNLARAQQLNDYRSKDPTLQGFQHADDILTSHTDPLMHEYMALPPGSERQAFIKRNFQSKADAQRFSDQVKGASHVLGP